MKNKIFNTNKDWTGLVIRLTLGLIMFPHGAQKMLGWFHGPGFSREMEHLTGPMHLPWVISILVIVIEFFGAISLLIGWASRLWAVTFIILFLGIIFTAHVEHGFFMNWFGNQKGEGYEYHLLVIGLCMALVLNGSGKYSVDQLISKYMTKK
ncbi:DoxX family protein [Chryseobacterium sp. Alg-005]|uniref:DoxX family protein n=1 Tax=Chryseobacterium sp. Alg-005 TaxID=3159516 RepID=UPI00355594A4